MGLIYLIRHGQAGTRDDYDRLSETGARQAQYLGEWLARQRVHFDHAFTGVLRRQSLTAQSVEAAYRAAGVPFPELVEDPRWNEFDLEAIYRTMVPHLLRDDPQFREEYEAHRRETANGYTAKHRIWNRCDAVIVDAWMKRKYPFDFETWEGFIDRIAARIPEIEAHEDGKSVAIFTSATPISVLMTRILGLGPERIFHFGGAMVNTALNKLRYLNGEWRLLSYNETPHLPLVGLRTER